MNIIMKRSIGMLLALVLVLTAAFSENQVCAAEDTSATDSTATVTTSTDTSSEKEESDKVDTSELEEKRQETIDKINSIKSDISTVKDTIAELQENKSSIKNAIAKLDAQVNALETQISDAKAQIAVKQEELDLTQAELEDAEEKSEQQYESMKIRIQFMYENGNESYLEMMLSAKSISDLINKSGYVAELSEYDSNMLAQYVETKNEIAAYKEQLEYEHEELEILSAELDEQKEAVNLAISAKSNELSSFQSQINSASSTAEEYADQLEEQEAALNKVEAAIAAAAAANASDSDGDGGASGLMWPCPGSHRITSYFGPRSAPTAGASTDHKGIDIGASYGSAIVASASGTVTTAAYSGSAGNYVVISHGGGLSTVYMHCSSLSVSKGDTVSKGQTIAAVGSTGYSTGNHLHFGVIKNGTYVNPLGYVS